MMGTEIDGMGGGTVSDLTAGFLTRPAADRRLLLYIMQRSLEPAIDNLMRQWLDSPAGQPEEEEERKERLISALVCPATS